MAFLGSIVAYTVTTAVFINPRSGQVEPKTVERKTVLMRGLIYETALELVTDFRAAYSEETDIRFEWVPDPVPLNSRPY